MTTILRSDDLSCPSCVARLESALNALGGVERATVSVTSGRIDVEHDPDLVDADTLIETVRDAGYGARRSPW